MTWDGCHAQRRPTGRTTRGVHAWREIIPFVHADAIDDGRSHARVFIGECKWWDGPKTITDAYQQLWEYLEVKDTFGMLLMFSRRVDFEKSGTQHATP